MRSASASPAFSIENGLKPIAPNRPMLTSALAATRVSAGRFASGTNSGLPLAAYPSAISMKLGK